MDITKRGEVMDESRVKQKLFILRERVRRNLIRTRPGETICLQYEEVSLLLKWIKELERKVEDGNQKH